MEKTCIDSDADYASIAKQFIKIIQREIETGKYHIFLQPKTDGNGRLRSVEALLRCSDEIVNVSIPDLISFLEHIELIQLIDFFVFEEVCKCLSQWQKKQFPSIVVSLNFSRKTLRKKDLVKEMESIRNLYDVQKGMIEIEITETQRNEDFDKEEHIIDQIHKAGYRLSLDDFGVEYSNLLYLIRYPFQILKLDKSLIDEIEVNWKNRVVLENVILTSHKIGIQVVAEGVENVHQLAYLNSIHCDFIQGYLMDKPMPVAEFEEKYLKYDDL